jgi:hypothetical protein
VKSAAYGDVKRSAVEEFFRNAPPRSASLAETVRLMRLECCKWHPDKGIALFRGKAPEAADSMMLDLICYVLLKIRDEAEEKRKA